MVKQKISKRYRSWLPFISLLMILFIRFSKSLPDFLFYIVTALYVALIVFAMWQGGNNYRK
ncbi:hypothetical protein A5881_000468 [Enterococcus termitis]